MNKIFLALVVITLPFPSICEARNSSTYHAPRHYKSGGRVKLQKGYIKKKSGKYVAPHLKTSPDNSKYNNLKQRQ